jgi:hypothetical protein
MTRTRTKKGWQRGGGLGDDCPAVPRGEAARDVQGSAGVCGRTTLAGRADSGGVSKFARTALQVPSETLIGKAVGHTLGQWLKLIRCFDHQSIGPDTSAVEGSSRGVAASATLFSIIVTVRANGKEHYWYLRKLFEELPNSRRPARLPTFSVQLRFTLSTFDRTPVGFATRLQSLNAQRANQVLSRLRLTTS